MLNVSTFGNTADICAIDAFWNSARNRRCTVTTDEVLAYSKTQNDCSRLPNAIFATTAT
jgi:hypothetical protein